MQPFPENCLQKMSGFAFREGGGGGIRRDSPLVHIWGAVAGVSGGLCAAVAARVTSDVAGGRTESGVKKAHVNHVSEMSHGGLGGDF